jgi:hypothetical protein
VKTLPVICLIILVAAIAILGGALQMYLGQPTDEAHDRQAALTLGLAGSYALPIVIGDIFGVPARIRVDHLRSAAVTSLTRGVLISYLIRNLGTALVALVAAGIALRTRFERPPGPAGAAPEHETVTPAP